MRSSAQDTELKRRRNPAASGLVGSSTLTPYAFSAPAVVVVSIILAFPVIYAVHGSLFRQHVLEPDTPFIGIGNYDAMLSNPEFWSALGRSIIFLSGVLIFGTVLALVFAFALLRATGRLRFLRSLTLTPYIVSGVAIAVMFRMIFNRDFGVINQVLEMFGIDGLPWLSDSALAMVAVIVVQVWGDLPLCILLILGGLQSINPALLDAAVVDGATGWKRTLYVSLPLIAPQVALSAVILSYGATNAFATVLTLTGGGPGRATEILAIHMYHAAFQVLDTGYAFAVVIALLLMNCALVILFVWLGRARGVD